MADQKHPARVLLEPLLLAIVAALLIRYVVQAYSIPSASMAPVLEVGDHVLVTPYLPGTRPSRGDVVVFRVPGHGDEVFVKRVVAEPGEVVEIVSDRLLINDRPAAEPYLASSRDSGFLPRLALPPDEYLVLGDNRGNSLDSRLWGPVPRNMILGKARIVFWSSGNLDSTARARAMSPLPAPHPPAGVRWSRILKVVR